MWYSSLCRREQPFGAKLWLSETMPWLSMSGMPRTRKRIRRVVGRSPDPAVTRIRVERTRGSWGRSIGTTLGVLTGLSVGGYAAATTSDSAGKAIPIFLVIAGAISVGGYYLGRSADRKVTVIQVVP